MGFFGKSSSWRNTTEFGKSSSRRNTTGFFGNVIPRILARVAVGVIPMGFDLIPFKILIRCHWFEGILLTSLMCLQQFYQIWIITEFSYCRRNTTGCKFLDDSRSKTALLFHLLVWNVTIHQWCSRHPFTGFDLKGSGEGGVLMGIVDSQEVGFLVC